MEMPEAGLKPLDEIVRSGYDKCSCFSMYIRIGCSFDYECCLPFLFLFFQHATMVIGSSEKVLCSSEGDDEDEDEHETWLAWLFTSIIIASVVGSAVSVRLPISVICACCKYDKSN